MIYQAIQTLYEYNTWANARILDTAAHLSPAQFLAARGTSFDSIRDTLVHIMSGQWIYLERWQGRTPRAPLDPGQFLDLAAIRARWDEDERDTQAFIAGIDDGQLLDVVEYTNLQEGRWAYPLWLQMLHQVNHATQHRSEAAAMLTRY